MPPWYVPEESEEKEVEPKINKDIIISLAIYGLIGGIGGFLSSIILKKPILIVIIGVFIGMIFGLLLSLLPKEQKWLTWIFLLIVVSYLAYVYFSENPEQLSFWVESFNKFKSLFSSPTLRCVTRGECEGVIPGFETEEENEVSVPDFSLTLSYEDDYIDNNNINMFISLEILNKKINNLILEPYCKLSEKGGLKERPLDVLLSESYSEGDRFIFPKSDTERKTGFRCKGSTRMQKETIIIGFNIFYKSDLNWIIKVGPKHKKEEAKIIKEEMPFNIDIFFPADMPLTNGRYDFFIKLKENPSYGFKLREINLTGLESTPDTNIVCEDFGNVIELDEEAIKEFYDEKDKEYVFDCQLIISNAPVDVVETRIINIKANYIVYKEFEKTIREK